MTDDGKKSLVLRSRYGSGKTTFMQRLIKDRNPKRVLFITYRQTLARDIMRNFGRLGFKNYLDGHDDPSVWTSPRLILQIDSLMKLLEKNPGVMNGGGFNLKYDMIVIDESESLLSHLDGGTMKGKEIDIYNFFDELLKHSKKMVLMDGDVSGRTLSFASSYGNMTYINNVNYEGNKTLNLICDTIRWETQLADDLDRFYAEDKNFRICIVCQGSGQALSMEEALEVKFPHLTIKRLVGTDSQKTKKDFLEDINKTLENTNIFIYSPTIESGVDITIKMKKLYGMLCIGANSQRAFLQMLGRSRNVEEGRIDVVNDVRFKINNNYNFWKYKELLELNLESVQQGLQWTVDGDEMRLSSVVDQRRKNISVFNHVEELNKHPSLFVNYLKTLVIAKGMTFEMDRQAVEEGESMLQAGTTKAKPVSFIDRKTNYKLEKTVDAKDLTNREFEELSELKKQGKTTTEENFRVDKHYWQGYLLTKELDPKLLKEFMYNNNPLNNFLSLVDIRNHRREDNLRSAKHLERTALADRLLKALGFASVVDKTKIDRVTLLTNFAKVCEDPDFRGRRRINELFDLNKMQSIDKEMNPQRILLWANSLLKNYGVCIRAYNGTYKLEDKLDLLALIKRKNEAGKYFVDGQDLLKQVRGHKDLFIDEETGEVKSKVLHEYDTSKLDVDVAFQMAEAELSCCMHGTCSKCKPSVSVMEKPMSCKRIVHPERLFPDTDDEGDDLDAKGRDLGYGRPPVGKENVKWVTHFPKQPPRQAPAWLLNRGRGVDVWID